MVLGTLWVLCGYKYFRVLIFEQFGSQKHQMAYGRKRRRYGSYRSKGKDDAVVKFMQRKRRKYAHVSLPRMMNIRTAGFSGIEYKFHDSDGDQLVTRWSPALTAPSPVVTLNSIGQGAGPTERVGRRCNITSAHVKFSIRVGDSSFTYPPSVRVLLVLDKQANNITSAQSSLGEIVNPSPEPMGTNGFRHLQSSSRFRVLFDRTYDMNGAGGGNSDARPVVCSDSINRHFKGGLPVLYSASTAVASSIVDNALRFFVFQGDQPAIILSPASINWATRVRFIEK